MSANRFKFRCWNGEMMSAPFELKDMIHDRINYEEGVGFMDKEGVSIYWPTMEEEGAHLMQSTGLLDKNGVEVWEGDIVKKHYGCTYPIFAVIWDGFKFISQQDQECLQELHIEGMEVIGNIYSNPELMEST